MANFTTYEITWVQDSPKNMGPWIFLQSRFNTAVRAYGLGPHASSAQWHEPQLLPVLHYIGRPAAASPATGSYRIHMAEQKAPRDPPREPPTRTPT